MSSKNYLFIFLIIASFVMRSNPSSANLSTWLLAAAAMLGPMEIILSIFLSWLYLSLNTSIFQDLSELGVLGRYAILISAFLYYVLNFKRIAKNQYIIKVISYSALVLILLLLHSIFFSINPVISISKSVLWIFAISIILVSWILLTSADKNYTFDRIFYTLLFVEILSILLIPYEVSRAVNREGFQGFLNHPQVFGIVASIICAIIFIKILKYEKNTPIFYLLLPISFALLSESKSRTALFSFVISATLFLPLFYCTLRNKQAQFKQFVLSLLIMFSGTVIVFTITHTEFFRSFIYSQVNEVPLINSREPASESTSNTETFEAPKLSYKAVVDKLVFKDSSDDNLLDTYITSRGGLISGALKDIKENTFFGVGFGTGKVDENKIRYAPHTDIAISYPVEKGVIVFAILQELGLVGTLFFILTLFYLLRTYFLKASIYLVLISVMILLNMGEFILMSTGGPGLLLIIFFTYIFSIEESKILYSNDYK